MDPAKKGNKGRKKAPPAEEAARQTAGKTLFSPPKGEKSSLAISGKTTPILHEGKASVSKRRPVLLRKHVLNCEGIVTMLGCFMGI